MTCYARRFRRSITNACTGSIALQSWRCARGRRSGFAFVLDNADMTTPCSEFNNPAFCMPYRSPALLHDTAPVLNFGEESLFSVIFDRLGVTA